MLCHARGASDDKGPIWSHLHAIELMDALGISPAVNVKFIFDGEEEIGSPFFGPFTEAHRDLLAADVVIVTDGPKHASGRPTITGGARGVLKLELVVESARRDVHSGNFAVPNPAWKLNGLLASMATPDGAPLIEGFEENVVKPTAAERQMMAELPLDLPAPREGARRRLARRLPRAPHVPPDADDPRAVERLRRRRGEHHHSASRHRRDRHPHGEEPDVGVACTVE